MEAPRRPPREAPLVVPPRDDAGAGTLEGGGAEILDFGVGLEDVVGLSTKDVSVVLDLISRPLSETFSRNPYMKVVSPSMFP